MKWNQLKMMEVEANDYEELDENELKFEIDKDQYQRKRESQIDESDVDIDICTIFVDCTVLKQSSHK